MSRGIKYRVWDNENKSYNDPYSYAYYALTQDGGLDFYCHGDHMDEANPDVYIIEQYTGLKDKNGKEIYEGDIVQDGGGEKCRVEWTKSEAHFGLYTGKQMELTDFIWMRGEDLEVVGNIHETPELLKEEE